MKFTGKTIKGWCQHGEDLSFLLELNTAFLAKNAFDVILGLSTSSIYWS